MVCRGEKVIWIKLRIQRYRLYKKVCENTAEAYEKTEEFLEGWYDDETINVTAFSTAASLISLARLR